MLDTAHFLKRVTVVSVEVKIGSNLAESSKEGYGSKRTFLPMINSNNRTYAST
jgi:hypothetical protein